MTEITIRDATIDDLEFVARYNIDLASETEDIHLDPAIVSKGVRALLEDPSKGRYFMALGDGVVIGQLATTYEWSDWRNANFWWIQSVYVDSQWRRQGVYRALHDYVYDIAKSRDDICGIRLYVERNNTVAQQTYDSLGMSQSHYHLYEIDFVL